MKKINLIIFISLSLFLSCNTKQKNTAKLLQPDTSISKNNSYNDIFFDSSELNKFCQEVNVDDEMKDRINNFYYSRNFEYAWFFSGGLNEQARSLWNLLTYTKTTTKDTSLYNKSLKNKMADLIINDSLTVTKGDKNILKTEFLLTEYFINYLDKNNTTDEDLNNKELQLFIPSKKEDLLAKAASMLQLKKQENGNAAALKAYNLLLQQLDKYYSIEKNKGWLPINFSGKILKQGNSSPVITAVKKRLAVTGELNEKDTSALFDSTLKNAVKNYQLSLGYTPSGFITDSLIKDMNVSAEKRLQQILINMHRMRWMPAQDSGKLILCNIPEYKLYVYENGNKVFDMNTVVGKDGHSTVIFTGNLNEIVFSPYWNLPPGIIQKEILPKIKDNKNYLKENNMEETGEANGIPVIRQLPGPKNSLGKVKFLFPNDFNIYFHDTPAKSLFQKDKRAYSHGCIRLSDPLKMAQYLLQDMKEWTTEKITAAMNSTKETHVELKHSVPVLITYYTSWVDDAGRLNFRDDIYAHDSTMAANMFTNAVK